MKPENLPKRIGEFEIVRLLGRGGLGSVFLAQNAKGQKVAVKFLTEINDKSLARFERELEVGKSLVHPNLIRTFGGGRFQGTPFLILEYLEGTDFGRVLRAHDKIPPGQLAKISGSLASALQYLHERGVVHRDLKPDNLHADRQGQIKILDLGLIHAAERTQLTKTGTVLGSFLYMAPEQIMGQKITPQADLFSYGLILYRMLTGGFAFFPEKSIQLNEYYPLLIDCRVLPWHPERRGSPLDHFFLRALRFEAVERFRSAQGMHRSFVRALKEEGLVDLPIPSGPEEDDRNQTQEILESLALSVEAPSPSPPGTPPSEEALPTQPGTAPSRVPERLRLPLAGAALGLVATAALALWLGAGSPAEPIQVLAHRFVRLSPQHRALLLKTDRSTRVKGYGGSLAPCDPEQTTHLLALPRGAASLNVVTDTDQGLFERQDLDSETFPEVRWGIDRPEGHRFSLPGFADFVLKEAKREGLYRDPPLPSPKELYQETLHRFESLGFPRLLQSKIEAKSSLRSLRADFESQNLLGRYRLLKDWILQETEAFLLENGGDPRAFQLSHAFLIYQAILEKLGAQPGIRPRQDGFEDLLLERRFAPPGVRPAEGPGRIVLPKHHDHVAIFQPDPPPEAVLSITSTTIRSEVTGALSALSTKSEDSPFLDLFFTQAARLKNHAFAEVTYQGLGPLYGFDDWTSDEESEWGRVHSKELSSIRRRLSLRLPSQAAQGGELQLRFLPYRPAKTTPMDRVILQAVALRLGPPQENWRNPRKEASK